ncbi:MAG: cytidine deaminase [Turicibacter sp.]|nr:cytidine deaminase [Turicibacter sp.]
MNENQLMGYAREALGNSYSPYSNFPVGAAILCKDGNIITGVNVENASFGGTNCAERSAIFTAVGKGYKKGDFLAIAVAGKTKGFLPPCCICRQVMVEFFEPDAPVYLTNGTQEIQVHSLKDLVPLSFDKLDI